MREMPRLLVSLFLAISVLVGCGGGGGGGGEPNGNSTTLKLLQDRADPGGFVTLQDSSLTAGEPVAVTFTNATGYQVTVNSVPAASGSAGVPVPPWFDGVTGEIAAGRYTLSLADGRQAQIEVAAPAELIGVAPGEVTLEYLQILRDNCLLVLAELDAFELDLGYDATAEKANVQRQIGALDASLHELSITGTLSAYSPFSGSVRLTPAELSTLDQWINMLAAGYASRIATRPQARVAAAGGVGSQEWADDLRRKFSLPGLVEQIPDDIREQQETTIAQDLAALKAFLKAKAGDPGMVVGEKVGAVRKLLENLAVGVTQTVANFSRSFTTGEEAEVAPELMEVVPDALRVATPETVQNFGDEAITWKDRLEWVWNKFCLEGIDIGDWRVDCNYLQKVRGLTSESKCKERLVGGPFAISGEAVTVSVVVYETQPGSGLGATNNTITVDWGDRPAGDPADRETIVRGPQTGTPAFGELILHHTYQLPVGLDQEDYTVTISLEGDNNPNDYFIISSVYQVWRGIEPLGLAATLPAQPIEVDAGHYYTFEASGGVSPYQFDIDWGDGRHQRAETESGRARGGHRYGLAGAYEIQLDLADWTGDSLHRTYPVAVGIPQPTGLATLCPATLTVLTPSDHTRTLLYSGFREDGAWERAECAYFFGEQGIHLDLEYAPSQVNAAACGQFGGQAGWVYDAAEHQVLGTERQLRVAVDLDDYPLGEYESLVLEAVELGQLFESAARAGLGEACESGLPPVTRPTLGVCSPSVQVATVPSGAHLTLDLVDLTHDDAPDRYRSYCNYAGPGELSGETALFHLTLYYTPTAISEADAFACGRTNTSGDVFVSEAFHSAWSVTRTVSASWAGGPENFGGSLLDERAVLMGLVARGVAVGLGEECPAP